mmetsp:Transcript_52339/g.124957  ORF Transcript_52339/g.124957 Transcript_52339/m.124957 type:complete len:1507 (-) Transcript_52339:58-4578(-)
MAARWAMKRTSRPADGSAGVDSLGNLLTLTGGYSDNNGLAKVQAFAQTVTLEEFGSGAEQDQRREVMCLDFYCSDSSLRAGGARAEVALVIDTSGSMYNAMQQVRDTCQRVFDELRPEDSLALISFSTWASCLLPMTPKKNITNFESLCSSLRDGGGTNLADGLRKGFDAFAPPSQAWSLSRFLSGGSNNEQLARPSEEVSCSLLLLSDGCPSVGECRGDAIFRKAFTYARNPNLVKQAVTVYTLGFMEFHDIDLMRRLPQLSTGSGGSYYYVGSHADIDATVGDCFGAITAVRACCDLKVNCRAYAGIGDEAPELSCSWFGRSGEEAPDECPMLGLQPMEALTPMWLQADEHAALLLVAEAGTEELLLELSWEDASGEPHCMKVVVEMQSTAPLTLQQDDTVEVTFERLMVLAHVLRLKVAVAIEALALNPTVASRYETLHASVLRTLTALQGTRPSGEANGSLLGGTSASNEEETIVFLEGMLQTLERDLGEAMATPFTPYHSKERQGVLLSFAAEHFSMRSASSLTRLRTAYASKAQIRTRLRFLLASADAGNAAKEAVVVEEEGLTEEEMTCRQIVDAEECFATLSTWRECVLGLGLFIHPRTCRERRAGIPPQVDLVVDYVSSEAYNFGVRALVSHVEDEEADVPSREDAAPPAVMSSSARQRINGWLPLFINEANWRSAKMFAPSAFSLISTQLNTAFVPEDALRVCGRLMCCAVVGFVRTNTDHPAASERAVQMYCDVHRLFLRMAEEHPEIRALAHKHLTKFINSPEMRTRKGTSDLGLLVTYLSILDSVSWADLYHVFVPEMVRRAFARMSEAFDPEMTCQTEEDIIARFDGLEPEHGRVILFFNAFNALVARPVTAWHSAPDASKAREGCDFPQIPLPVHKVEAMYDRRWGRLSDCRRDALIAEIRRLHEINSVKDVLQELIPHAFTTADTAELLLWASNHGDRQKVIQEWPNLRSLGKARTQVFHNRCKLRAAVIAAAEGLSRNETLPPGSRLTQLLMLAANAAQSAKQAEISESQSQRAQGYKYSSREEACVAAAAAREAALALRERAGKEEALPIVRTTTPHFKERPAQGSTFGLNVRVAAAASPTRQELVLTVANVPYVDENGKLTTGQSLRELIAQEAGVPANTLRVLLCNVPRRCAIGPEASASASEDAADDDKLTQAVSNSALLWTWNFEALSDLSVALVERKQRGGKKPGNGWHRLQSQGRTYVMNIAAAIVRDRTFARVQQYFTALPCENASCLKVVEKLCDTCGSDAVILCGGGSRSILLEATHTAGLIVGHGDLPGSVQIISQEGRRITLVAEKDAEPALAEAGTDEDEEESLEELEARQAGDLPKQQVLPMPVELVYSREEVQRAGFVVVWNGSCLREVASLGGLVNTMAETNREVNVFHLVSNERAAVISDEEERQLVLDAAVERSGISIEKAVELPGQPHIPRGAELLHVEMGDLIGCEFPLLLKYKLRAAQLGLVMRLKSRFGIPVTEVPWDALKLLVAQE